MHNDELHSPRWSPPHCPNRNCKFHSPLQPGWRFKRLGHYLRKAQPRRIRRFQCLDCGVSFSSQTFSVTYWLRKPDIILDLTTKVTSGACNSQIAVDLGVSPATIDRHIYRLGRHMLLFHARMMHQRPPLDDLAIDGFASFEHSQYHPFHFQLAIARRSSFIPYFTDSELRRSGRMTAYQKRRRREFERIRGRPDPQAVRKDVHELLQYVTRGATAMTIHSDDHRAYRRAMEGIRCRIRHVVTSSRDVRDRANHLFEVNLADLLLRHGLAEHRRETIAYAKRRNCAAYKLAIFVVHRNYVRPRRVRRERRTPAELAGVCARRLTVSEVVARRLFVDGVGLEGRWREYYWLDVRTRALKVNRRHELRYAV